MEHIGYRHFEVRPCNPVIGARVRGLRFGPHLPDEAIEEVKVALDRHLVLFFEGQDITPAEQVAFGRRFGRLQVHQYLPSLPDHPEIVVLENDRDRPPQVNFWHSDVTFLEEPPLGSILLAREIPPCGGDTIWSNMYAAYEALSEPVRRAVDGLRAVHVGQVERYEAAYGKGGDAPRKPPRAEHPVVRIHPRTGRKALFVHPAATASIVGLPKSESDALLQMLFRHADTPEFQVRLTWMRDMVAFWDNRCTQHYAVADYWPERRLMHRVTMDGDRPY